MKPSLWLVAIASLAPLALSAQNTQRSEYEQYVAGRQQAFKHYVDTRNAEYIRYMKQQWSRASERPAEVAPPQPKPVIPPATTNEEPAAPVQIPVATVIPKPKPPLPTLPPAEQAQPTLPQPIKPIPAKPTGPQVSFTFLGATCHVTDITTPKPRLTSATEAAVAASWEALAAPEYKSLVNDCQRIRKELALGDWGYLKLVETLATKWYPAQKNDATLLQIFLLAQSGYQVRIARSKDRIILLIPTEEILYGHRYIALGKERYYIISDEPAPDGYTVFDRAFPQEKRISLRSTTAPNLPNRNAPTRKFASKRYPELKVEVAVNLNLMELYNLYPTCDVALYAAQPSTTTLKEGLYPQLKRAIEGRPTPEAARMLLDFVQTAFEYMTDQEQFGHERPLFAEESLYYPHNDCEDRAVLFARLVRELLGAEVVLLNYPEHIATAVRFTETVEGDYLIVGGKRYTVCDPTYIGADIGKTMPGMSNKTVKVVLW